MLSFVDGGRIVGSTATGETGYYDAPSPLIAKTTSDRYER